VHPQTLFSRCGSLVIGARALLIFAPRWRWSQQNTKKIEGVQCVEVEPDIDYFKDLGAHTVLEVIPNSITHGLTDPKKVYVLQWIAGRHAGVPEFVPPYTIAA
jgi:hypothetical protein